MSDATPEQKAAAKAHLLANLALLRNRDFLLDLFTEIERVTFSYFIPDDEPEPLDHLVETEGPMYVGKLLQSELGWMHEVTAFHKAGAGWYHCRVKDTGFLIEPEKNVRLLSPQDPITVPPGTLANMGDAALETTVGRVVMNYLIFADPFGAAVPFLNTLWKPGPVEGIVADLLLQEKVTVEQHDRYMQNLYFIGHATELAVPSYSMKSLTTDPRIPELKRALLTKHAEEIKKGNVVVMAQIEDALIALDREWLKDDEAMGFLNSSKAFDVQRKKMLLIGGVVEAFGKKGEYAFIENSLEEGWTPEAFPTICNEIRAGSYSRAKETAKGGEETKFLMRVFQNVRVTEQDCGTRETFRVLITPDIAEYYEYRNAVMPNGTIVTLVGDQLKAVIGKSVELRSTKKCKTKDGYCFTCMGQKFGRLDQVSTTMSATDAGSSFTTMALKSMHGGKVGHTEITSLNRFLL